MSVSSWDDPDRNTGAPFTITVDWGDGTTSQQTVAGTNDDATTFEVSHRYTTELDLATLSYCIHTDSGQLVACFERRNAISIGNMRPFVNAADLSTLPQDHEGLGGNNTIACYAGGGDCVLMGETLLPDPSGRSMVTTGNTGSLNVRHSPVPFAEGGYRSEEHTSELPSLMRISYAVFCLKKKNQPPPTRPTKDLHEAHH